MQIAYTPMHYAFCYREKNSVCLQNLLRTVKPHSDQKVSAVGPRAHFAFRNVATSKKNAHNLRSDSRNA